LRAVLIAPSSRQAVLGFPARHACQKRTSTHAAIGAGGTGVTDFNPRRSVEDCQARLRKAVPNGPRQRVRVPFPQWLGVKPGTSKRQRLMSLDIEPLRLALHHRGGDRPLARHIVCAHQ